jgi:hypothetical protein
MIPLDVKSLFGSYPESRRFFKCISWFLLLPAGVTAEGAPIAAYAFVQPDGFGFIAAAD